MAITIVIYTYTGVLIWTQRRQLRGFSHSASHPNRSMMSTRTTEVKVTREVITSRVSNSDASDPSHDNELEDGMNECGEATKRGYKPYSVTIDAGGTVIGGGAIGGGGGIGTPCHGDTLTVPRAGLGGRMASSASVPCRSGHNRNREGDDVAWSYTRAALSYFVAMVITWVSHCAHDSVVILSISNRFVSHLDISRTPFLHPLSPQIPFIPLHPPFPSSPPNPENPLPPFFFWK